MRLAPDVGALALRAADGLAVRHEKIERMPMRSGKAAVCAERMEEAAVTRGPRSAQGAPKDPVVASALASLARLGGGMDERFPWLCSTWTRSLPTQRSAEPSCSGR